MTRERLSLRRQSITDCARWPLEGGRRIHVTAGFGSRGQIAETFLRGGGRVGSAMDFLLDDIAVIISRSLQHGDRLGEMAQGLGRLPSGEAASVVGAVVGRLLAIERGKP